MPHTLRKPNQSGISLKRLVVSLALVSTALALCVQALIAGTPSSGTLSPANPILTYTGGPFTLPNQTSQTGDTPPVCTAVSPCDQFALKIAIPEADAGKKFIVDVKVEWTDTATKSDYDLYIYKGGATGTQTARAASERNPEIASFSASFPGANGDYTVFVVPFATQPTVPFSATITLRELSPTPNPTPAPPEGAPLFENYQPPGGLGRDAGEPSIGVNFKTGNVLFQAGLQTLRVTFNDCTSPARAIWVNKPGPNTQTITLDPILFTDPDTGRTIVSQLAGKDSLAAFTDNDGDSYTVSEGGSIGTSGVDHQTIGGGPFRPGAPDGTTAYPHAVYYASQDIADATLATSRDGGLTFGPAVPMYSIEQCGGLHGHVKVAPDGTVYVPNKGCDQVVGGISRTNQAAIVSADEGTTFAVRLVPTSKPGGSDPSIGIARTKPAGQVSHTIYFGYVNADGHPRIAVSRDRGVTWTDDQDVGTRYGTVNTVFPAVVAGDDDRAAFAYLGTSTPGPSTGQDPAVFNGEWHLYIATTYDGGKTWLTTDATPTDPVQRSVICTAGTLCRSGTRNLLDFNDVTIDKMGRVLAAYADGCIGDCATDPNVANSGTAVASIARQSGGRTLFAANDATAAQAPASPLGEAIISDGKAVRLTWSTPADNGSPITGFNIYRGSDAAPEGLLGTVGPGVRSFDDPNSAATNFYYVTATNAIGESARCDKLLPALALPTPNVCVLPGATVVEDGSGDQLGGPGGNKDLDIQSISIAEPFFDDGSNKLVFTMKVADLSAVPPNRQYRIIWTPKAAPSATEDRYYVGMTSNGAGTVSYEYGTVTSQGNVPRTRGAADAGSFSKDGTIRITVSNSKVGDPKRRDSLSTLSGRNFAGNGLASLTKSSAADSTGDSSYSLAGNASCAVTPQVPPAALLNLSTRVRVQTGDRAAIGGLIIDGPVPKKVVFRAIGPSLKSGGQPFDGRLNDPTLELYRGDELIGSNDNWRDSQEQEISDSQLAPQDGRESAMVRTLDPGLYTAIVRGKNDEQGVGLVEAYDGDVAVDRRLVNLSTRGVAETGDNVLIGGFIAGIGNGPTNVVVRAIGPSLATRGVPDALQDPTVELINQNGEVIVSNDDFGSSPQRADIESRGLAPEDGREAAVFQAVNPGNYTAIVRGKGEATGTALVEVYDVQ